MEKHADFIIIGAAISNILTHPVTAKVFSIGSVPANHILMQTGGDALNEAGVLAGLSASSKNYKK